MNRYRQIFAATFCAVIITLSLPTFAQELTANDVIAKSIAAVGTPQARAQLSYYELGGKSKMRTSIRSISAEGTAILVSEKNQVKLKMTFDSKSFSGDQFVYDGRNVMIAKSSSGMRSAIGDFLFNEPKILSDGLLGGILSTAWPLFDPKLRGAKVEYDGVKKIDGAKLYQLTYNPKKGDDRMTIHLYFDESFRHVKTVYELITGTRSTTLSRMSASDTAGNSFLLEESFSGFLNIAGLTLPTRHSLSFTSTNAELGRWNIDFVYDDLNGTKLPAVD